MFGWLFSKREEDITAPVVVHYGTKFAVKRIFYGSEEFLDSKDKDYWWMQRYNVERFCIFDTLEEANAALRVALKHNTPVEE